VEGEDRCVGICVVLESLTGELVNDLPDPAGGTFDAAGDFDRLLEAPDLVGAMPWSLLDPMGEVFLDRSQMRALLEQLATVSATARPGPEARGLTRLVTLAVRCRDHEGLRLRASGD